MADKYTPYPTVEPKFTPTPSIHETFPEVRISNAVGEALSIVGHGTGVLGQAYQAVGESYGKLGRSAEHAGNELFQRAEALKNLEIDKQVDDAVLKNHMAQGKNSDEFLALEGENASPEVYQAYMKKGAEARQAIESSLPSDEAKRRYRHESMGSMGSEFRSMGKHASTEQKSTLDKSAEAQVNMFKDKAGKAEGDVEFSDAMKGGRDIITNKQRHLKGWSDEQTQLALNQFESEAYANRADIMSRSKPSEAMKFLEENKDKITHPDTYRKAYNTVSDALTDAVARSEAGKAHGDDPDKPIEEKVKEAREGAMKGAVAVGAPQLADKMADDAEKRVRTLDGLYRGDKKRSEDDNRHSIAGMIMGDNPSGKKLNSKEELFSNPQAKAAWEKGDYDDRAYWSKLLNSHEEFPPNDRLFSEVMGNLKYGTDQEQQKAMSLKVWDLPMSQAQLKEIHLEQQKLLQKGRQAVENPKAHEVYQWGVNEGLITGIKKGSPEYTRYMGALDKALEIRAEEKGKELNNDEKKDLIRRMNRQVTIGKEEPQPQAFGTQPVPQEIIDHVRRTNPGMTEEEIRQGWLGFIIRNQWDTLLKTGKTDERTGKSPPAPPTKPMPTKPNLLEPKEM
jgi:hypothetical protein